MIVRSGWWVRAISAAACCAALASGLPGCSKPPDPKPQPSTVDKLKSPNEKDRDAAIDDVQKEYETKK